MADYKLSNLAKEDLIRIHQYGIIRFGMKQADRYFDSFFRCFDQIAQNPFSFEFVNYTKEDYRRCVCGVDSIYYRIRDSEVEIMTIIGKQDLENIL